MVAGVYVFFLGADSPAHYKANQKEEKEWLAPPSTDREGEDTHGVVCVCVHVLCVTTGLKK